MAQTIALSPTTAAANSADIVVSTGPASVSVYGPGPFSASIERKIGSDWYPAGQSLTHSTTSSVAITAPGTYRVVKQPTPGAIGVAVDS